MRFLSKFVLMISIAAVPCFAQVVINGAGVQVGGNVTGVNYNCTGNNDGAHINTIAAFLSASGGGTIFLSPGPSPTCDLTSPTYTPVILPPNVTLDGGGITITAVGMVSQSQNYPMIVNSQYINQTALRTCALTFSVPSPPPPSNNPTIATATATSSNCTFNINSAGDSLRCPLGFDGTADFDTTIAGEITTSSIYTMSSPLSNISQNCTELVRDTNIHLRNVVIDINENQAVAFEPAVYFMTITNSGVQNVTFNEANASIAIKINDYSNFKIGGSSIIGDVESQYQAGIDFTGPGQGAQVSDLWCQASSFCVGIETGGLSWSADYIGNPPHGQVYGFVEGSTINQLSGASSFAAVALLTAPLVTGDTNPSAIIGTRINAVVGVANSTMSDEGYFPGFVEDLMFEGIPSTVTEFAGTVISNAGGRNTFGLVGEFDYGTFGMGQYMQVADLTVNGVNSLGLGPLHTGTPLIDVSHMNVGTLGVSALTTTSTSAGASYLIGAGANSPGNIGVLNYGNCTPALLQSTSNLTIGTVNYLCLTHQTQIDQTATNVTTTGVATQIDSMLIPTSTIRAGMKYTFSGQCSLTVASGQTASTFSLRPVVAFNSTGSSTNWPFGATVTTSSVSAGTTGVFSFNFTMQTATSGVCSTVSCFVGGTATSSIGGATALLASVSSAAGTTNIVATGNPAYLNIWAGTSVNNATPNTIQCVLNGQASN